MRITSILEQVDRKTDFVKPLLNHVLINKEDAEPDDSVHFGIIKLFAVAISTYSFFIVISWLFLLF